MLSLRETFKKLGLILLMLLVYVPSFADEGKLSLPHRHGIPLPESVLNKPDDYKNSDQFYRTYFSKSDEKIRQSYLSRWDYNDRQKPWNLLQGPDRYFATASLENYRNQRDEPLRKEFATQTLRVRLEEAIDVQFQQLAWRPIHQAHKSLKGAIDKIQNVTFTLGKSQPSANNANRTPATPRSEIRMGYDVLSDRSKLEYVRGVVDVGMYHPNFVSAILGSKDKFSLLTMAISSNFSPQYPKATISYPVNLSAITATMSRPISRNLDSAIISSCPLRDPSALSRLELRLSFRF